MQQGLGDGAGPLLLGLRALDPSSSSRRSLVGTNSARLGHRVQRILTRGIDVDVRAVAGVGADEALLVLRGGVEGVGALPGEGWVVVVVAPFREVVCEFQAGGVGVCVFEVDDDELFVGVCGEEERGGAGGEQAEDVAVLSLEEISRGD